jgi:hypothetical protein
MSGKALIENRMAPGFLRSVFESAGDIGEEVCGFVEAAFGTLGDELWRGRGGVFEDLWEGELVI